MKGGYVAVFVIFFIFVVVFSFGVVANEAGIAKAFFAALAIVCLGLIWLAYRRTIFCRAVRVENGILTVIFRSGKTEKFTLPDSIKRVAALRSDSHLTKPDNIQFELRSENVMYLLNTDSFGDQKRFIAELDRFIPVCRCFSDGRVEPSALSKMERGADFKDVIGNADEVRGKLNFKCE